MIEILNILSLLILFSVLFLMFYYNIRIHIVLFLKGKNGHLFARSSFGSHIKEFVEVIDNESNVVQRRKYIKLYNCVKYSRWSVLGVVVYLFLYGTIVPLFQ